MVTVYLASKEAANYLGMSIKSLEKWRLLREGPPYVKLGRAVRYRQIDLDAYMAERLVKPFASNEGEGLS
jgi:predicted DNA-binding transcriptional regulator AlpA